MNKKKIDNIPDWMVIGAVRYAMGRMTYIVKDTCDWLVKYWPELPDSVRSVIKRDLEEEIDRDYRARSYSLLEGPWPLGWDADRDQWFRVRTLYVFEKEVQP